MDQETSRPAPDEEADQRTDTESDDHSDNKPDQRTDTESDHHSDNEPDQRTDTESHHRSDDPPAARVEEPDPLLQELVAYLRENRTE
ncbi:MAG: hypothetical protein M3065_02070, partial [Actinomycetota bacterium]|nr:hypothetical protein [Actinomycetota bacterium]